MHSSHKQLTVWLVVFGHMLVGCFQPYTGINKQNIPAVEKAPKTDQLSSNLTFTTADNQCIYLTGNQQAWYAHLQPDTSTKPLPVKFLPGYTIQDLADSQPPIQSQLLHIIYSIEDSEQPSYLLVGNAEQPNSNQEAKQLCPQPNSAEITTLLPKTKLQALTSNILNYQQGKPSLEPSSGTREEANYRASTHLYPTIPTNRTAQIIDHPMHDRYPTNKAIHRVIQTNKKRDTQQNNHLPNQFCSATLWAPGGHKVVLEHQYGKWMAHVKRSLPIGFTQTLYLPAYIESDFMIETLLRDGASYQQRHLEVCFPEKDFQRGLGYVYVGCRGLLGGSPAKATPEINNILIKHQGPFHYLQPTDDRIIVKEVHFMPQMGFWWAEITYTAYSNDTKRYKKETIATVRIPVDTDQLEPFYAEDIARAQVTMQYSIDNPSLARPIPTFHSIKITRSSLLPSTNKKSIQEVEKPDKAAIIETEEGEIERIEKAAYEAFIQSFSSTPNIQEIIANSQQLLQEIIHRFNIEDKNIPLEAEARALGKYLVELIKILKSRYKATNDLYFGPGTSDYINQQILQGFKELNELEQNIQSTENSLKILCHTFHFENPSYNLELPVDPKALLAIVCNRPFLLKLIDIILETKVPGGQLIQIILGRREEPQSWEEWLPVAIETALDFFPRGKASRFSKLLSGKTLQTEFKKLIIKQAKEKAKESKQANKRKKDALAKETHQGKHQ